MWVIKRSLAKFYDNGMMSMKNGSKGMLIPVDGDGDMIMDWLLERDTILALPSPEEEDDVDEQQEDSDANTEVDLNKLTKARVELLPVLYKKFLEALDDEDLRGLGLKYSVTQTPEDTLVIKLEE